MGAEENRFMIESFIVYIEATLLPLGAWGVFLATLIEQIIAPIPSAFVQLGAGFFLVDAQSFFDALVTIFVVVALPSALAVGIGSLLVYYAAYFIGKPLVQKWGRFLGVSWSDVELLQKRFRNSRKDDVLLLALRSLPAVPTVAVDIFCGVVRYNLTRYIVITFIGTFIRATAFGLIGWRVGSLYVTYAEYISGIEKYILAGAIVAIVLFVVLKIKKNNPKI